MTLTCIGGVMKLDELLTYHEEEESDNLHAPIALPWTKYLSICTH
jgi:hypothetical protein